MRGKLNCITFSIDSTPDIKHLLYHILFLLLCHAAQAQLFQLPLKGVEGKDYMIGFYADHDEGAGIKDPFCGSKTYNNHPGTDFLIRSFKTMDSGVYIYAIADGIVFGTKDGLPDRNKHPARQVMLGNYAAILHYGKYKTYYGQLQKHSLLVKMGDSVKAGQVIGRVGSSGYSSYPHLHLEIKNGHEIVDPFAGTCNDTARNLWALPSPVYDTSVYIFDHGFVPYVPMYDSLTERHMVTDTFSQGDTTVCYWVLVHGLQPGFVTRVEWLDPKGKNWFTLDDTVHTNRWFTYDWSFIPTPSKKGIWTAQYYVNNKLLATKKFYLRK